jgi:hypothetical protein
MNARRLHALVKFLAAAATLEGVALGHDLPNHAPHVHDSWITALAPIAQPLPLLFLAASLVALASLFVRRGRAEPQRA